MKSDIEIAREIKTRPIMDIGKELGLSFEKLIPYGHDKAKVNVDQIDEEKVKRNNLILVTAITPTKAGIGKTTTSVGLSLGLNKIGKKAIVALREPSLGPCFGMKGGATGGGYSQVLPMEDINLHFTGDFHAITTANNTLAALLDNYQYQNKGTDKQLKEILWKRVLDVNDRSLRYMLSGLGGSANGIPQETGFDITPASEIMAIFCLSKNMDDLRQRIDNILLGYTNEGKPFTVKDLGVGGALMVLLKDAIQPNLTQTTELTPAIIHGGPFANIAHGCNSILATKMAMSLGDYTVTEAGFGADLGAEKFLNIKCRLAGITPKATVIVVTSQALKLHGNVPQADISKPNMEGLKEGLKNLQRHLENLKNFGQSVIIAFNQYGFDTEEEMGFMRSWAKENGVRFALNSCFLKGGDGAIELAKEVVDVVENNPSKPINHTYELGDDVVSKVTKIATSIYRAKEVVLSKKAETTLKRIVKHGYSQLPICIAKTQYSFSDDASLLGTVSGHTITIDNFVINAGAGFIVAIAGEIMRMPGLPKEPQANVIDYRDGQTYGLS